MRVQTSSKVAGASRRRKVETGAAIGGQHVFSVLCKLHEWQDGPRAASLPIIDIALAVGYQTPSAFAASFRRLTGVTPTEYRKSL